MLKCCYENFESAKFFRSLDIIREIFTNIASVKLMASSSNLRLVGN